jgi:aspartate carbamoyltransferase catalytic subunit
MGASEYVGKGETLVDAFANLDTIVNYKQRAAIVMTHGNKRATAFAHPVVMRRIAESKMFRITWTKLYARALA